MDQLKQFLAQVKKHHFWLLCGLAVLTSLIGWYFSKNALSKEYLAGRTEVQSKLDQVKRVLRIERHQNAQWTEGVKELTKKLKGNVFEAWSEVYGEQRK